MLERTIRTKRIYKGRIIGLREDTVKLTNGVVSKREIVEHPGAVAVIAVTSDNKLLLIKQFRKSADKVLLEIPAGLVHKGESWKDGAKRELEEETGYRAGKVRELFWGYSSPGYSTEIIKFFIATDLKRTAQNTDKDEIINVHPVPLGKAIGLIRNGRVRDNKTIAGIFAANLWKR